MNAIILAAGMGTRLRPFTETLPKSMLMLGKNETIIGRTIRQLEMRIDGQIVVATGYMKDKFSCYSDHCTLVHNPFYGVTNSIASLWFCREYLNDDVFLINGDVVLEDKLFDFILGHQNEGFVCVDHSRAKEGDYNVAINADHIVMMSKELTNPDAEYAGVTLLKKDAARALCTCVESLVENDQINEWYENALVHMILHDDFKLNYLDISQYQWTEVDCADDFLRARIIYEQEK
jgi:choline kinase